MPDAERWDPSLQYPDHPWAETAGAYPPCLFTRTGLSGGPSARTGVLLEANAELAPKRELRIQHRSPKGRFTLRWGKGPLP